MQNEVIIDGVDVTECEFAVKPINDNRIKCHCVKGLLQLARIQEQPESIKSGLCENNPDCHFKQLQRAKAELEQYKNDIASGVGCIQCKKELENCALKSELEQYKKSTQATYDYLEIERKRLVFETKTLKAENEKLKKELDNFRRVD